MTLGEWVRDATGRLAAAGLESPALEARRMAEAVCGLAPAQLVLAAAEPLTAARSARLERLVEGRVRHVPLQYLLGRAAFRQLDLEVGPGVFIPRPETEELVEHILPFVRAKTRAGRAARILELCVGSGAILAALLTECPGASGVGVEASPAAWEFATRNLAGAGLGDRVLLLQGDLYRPLVDANIPGDFDLVVANPPYIPSAVLPGLPAQVRLHEPSEALDGGPDGTLVIARILLGVSAWLAPGGLLALEIDESHAGRVRQLMIEHAMRNAHVVNDASGRARFVLGTR